MASPNKIISFHSNVFAIGYSYKSLSRNTIKHNMTDCYSHEKVKCDNQNILVNVTTNILFVDVASAKLIYYEKKNILNVLEWLSALNQAYFSFNIAAIKY